MSQESDAMKNVICVIVLSSICYLCINAQYCPRGWVFYKKGAKCFRILESAYNWSDSRLECRKIGTGKKDTDLLVLDDSTSLTFLKDWANDQLIAVWIAGNDMAKENTFVWATNNKTATHLDWKKKQPNDYSGAIELVDHNFRRNQDCLQLVGWKVHDAQCHSKGYPACQISNVDPCKKSNGGCGSGLCLVVKKEKICVCPTRMVSSAKGKEVTCKTESPCNQNNGGCSHICSGGFKFYTCSCPKGFFLSLDYRTCKDINECEFLNGKCNQVCENFAGSYRCACLYGYGLVNDQFCEVDIDTELLPLHYKILPHLMGFICSSVVFAALKFHYGEKASKEENDQLLDDAKDL